MGFYLSKKRMMGFQCFDLLQLQFVNIVMEPKVFEKF